jgi:hypothetical protein
MVILNLGLSTLMVIVMKTQIVIQIIIFSKTNPSYVIKHFTVTELHIVAVVENFPVLSV